MWRTWLVETWIIWLTGTASLWGCGPGGSDGDADPDSTVCDLTSSACCADQDCSNGRFCDGVEICVDGICQPDPEALCVVSGCRLDCEDGLLCTEDSCDEDRRRCVHQPTHRLCDDGDLCTGDERCEPLAPSADERGCVAGLSFRCDDDDPCTDDFCLDGECRTKLRDADGDGHGDFACQLCTGDGPESCLWGSDCDDHNPRVNPDAHEVCGDGLDNDCNRARDYADSACTITNDECPTPLDLVPGEVVYASTRGASGDIDSGCSDPSDRDVVFHFINDSVHDVSLIVSSTRGGPLSLALTAVCGEPEAELRCLPGRDFALRTRALAAGSYYVVVSSAVEVDFALSLELAEPAEPPAGDGCDQPIELDSDGGRTSGSTRGMWADGVASCGAPTDLDLVYRFELAEPRSLELALEPGAGPLSLTLGRSCGETGPARSCVVARDAVRRQYTQLEPGAWYLVFATAREDDFTFDLSFGPPSVIPISPPIASEDHTLATRTAPYDDNQYDIDISPLDFPFNGDRFDCVAVSTNGYLRFGRGSCPMASGFSDRETDIDQVFAAGVAQISWLGDDGADGGPGLRYSIERDLRRVVLTFPGHRDVGSEGTNDVQIILDCDRGDIQISYLECSFDNAPSGHWSIGLSEPGISSGVLHPWDFTAHELGTMASFGPGAIAQAPTHEGAGPYEPLNHRAIYFQRRGDGWNVVVDWLPE
jgi:hypothetical protein